MSKWILISVENNDIAEPDVFDTFEQAYEAMKSEVNRLKDYGDDVSIRKNYSCIQSDCDMWDWRIFEVKY